MKFEGTIVTGFAPAVIGMRLPMSKNYEDAKSKCDSVLSENFVFGKDDLRLAKGLQRADGGKVGAGTPNSKFLQMIQIWVCIEAPLVFWNEMDTYRHMVKNSTSRMHKLHSYEIDYTCFEVKPSGKISDLIDIEKLEAKRKKYNESKDKDKWYDLLYSLPDSWLQSRMCHFNYQTLKDIITWRKDHKQQSWSGKDNPEMMNFMTWAKTLPYVNELFFED